MFTILFKISEHPINHHSIQHCVFTTRHQTIHQFLILHLQRSMRHCHRWDWTQSLRKDRLVKSLH